MRVYKFQEGGTAFYSWAEGGFIFTEMPACPYPLGSQDAKEWQTGFDDADDAYNDYS